MVFVDSSGSIEAPGNRMSLRWRAKVSRGDKPAAIKVQKSTAYRAAGDRLMK
jgi:hypothetical protein